MDRSLYTTNRCNQLVIRIPFQQLGCVILHEVGLNLFNQIKSISYGYPKNRIAIRKIRAP